MHHLIRHCSRVIENYRTDWRAATPLPQALASLTRLTQGVECGGPGGVGSVALVDRGESVLDGARFVTVVNTGVRTERLGACDTESAGDGGAERIFLEGDGLA